MSYNVNELFLKSLNHFSIEDLAYRFGLHKNTISRWKEKKNVPPSYRLDFLRLLNVEKDTKKMSVFEKDQYFTKTSVAYFYFSKLKNVLRDLEIDYNQFVFIEPSAGDGSFFRILPQNRRIGIDIEPRTSGLIKGDYLKWYPKDLTKRYIVIGNPPFGLRGHLALQFINHSEKFADVVAFILPQLFESDGKGAPSKRVKGYKLAFSEKLPPNSFVYPDGSDIDIHTIFQVWTKINLDKIKIKPKKTCKDYIKIYSLSDGGTPSTTRNKKMLNSCDIYLPSTTFSKMKGYSSFEDLPHRRGYGVVILKDKKNILKLLKETNWEKVSFRSTNSAKNLRSSLIEKVLTDKGYVDRNNTLFD